MKTTAPRELISNIATMDQATRKYLRQQVINSGVSNAILNSLFFYLFNRDMGVIIYKNVFTDAFITCGFVAALVTWPTSHFTRKVVMAGLVPMQRINLIDRLPKKWPFLWLVLWLFSAFVVELLTWLGFKIYGVSEISFPSMLAVKFVSMGLLGGVLGALVAARYLQPGAVIMRRDE